MLSVPVRMVGWLVGKPPSGVGLWERTVESAGVADSLPRLPPRARN